MWETVLEHNDLSSKRYKYKVFFYIISLSCKNQLPSNPQEEKGLKAKIF